VHLHAGVSVKHKTHVTVLKLTCAYASARTAGRLPNISHNPHTP